MKKYVLTVVTEEYKQHEQLSHHWDIEKEFFKKQEAITYAKSKKIKDFVDIGESNFNDYDNFNVDVEVTEFVLDDGSWYVEETVFTKTLLTGKWIDGKLKLTKK